MYYLKFSLSPGLTVGSTPLNHLFEGGRRAGQRERAQRKRFKNTSQHLCQGLLNWRWCVEVPRLRLSHLGWSYLRRSTISGEQRDQSSWSKATGRKRTERFLHKLPSLHPTWVLRPDWPYQPPADTQIDPASFPMSSSTTKDEQQTTCWPLRFFVLRCFNLVLSSIGSRLYTLQDKLVMLRRWRHMTLIICRSDILNLQYWVFWFPESQIY